MSVARVVERGEKFDDCGFASKWEWVSVNGRQIGLVGRKRKKPLGHSKLCLFVRAFFVFVFFNKLLRNPDTLQYDEDQFTKEEDRLSWE